MNNKDVEKENVTRKQAGFLVRFFLMPNNEHFRSSRKEYQPGCHSY